MGFSLRYLGIDYGDLRIGLAIYDSSVDFIYPYKTLIRKRPNVLRKNINEIVDIIESENINKIVLGLPLNIDDSIGYRVEVTELFSKMLKMKLDPDIEIIYQDERYSSIESEEFLKSKNYSKDQIKKNVDQVAAMIILNDYKESLNGR